MGFESEIINFVPHRIERKSGELFLVKEKGDIVVLKMGSFEKAIYDRPIKGLSSDGPFF